MPRRSLAYNLKRGVVTPPNIAELAGVSTPTVYKWIHRGYFAVYKQMPDSNEYHISAKSVVEFFKKNKFAIPSALQESAEIFVDKYNDDFTLKIIPVTPRTNTK